MQLNITTRASGQREFRSRFKALQRASNETLDELGKEQVKITQERIRTGKQTPDGQAWAPWSLATLRKRTREGSAGGGLLYRTGALMNSIKYRVSNKTLTVYSDSPYGTFIQNGTWRMPARQFLGWSQAQLNRIKDIMRGLVE